MEAALAAPPDNVDLFGKVRAPLEERFQQARKEARDSKPLDHRLEGCRGALQRASKAKQAAIAQQRTAQAAFEKADANEARIRAELAELEKQALSQTTQPTCLQTISCKAAPLSAAVTELSRHMPATEAPTIQNALDGLLSPIAQAAEKASRAEAEGSATCGWDCHDEDLDLDTPDDVLLDTLTRGSESDAQEMLRAVRRRIRAKQCSDVSVGFCDGKHSRMTPMTVVSANIATLDLKAERAARAGLCQGQRAEELKRMFDDAGADVIALQEHRLHTN